jgi:hypothetical protein
VSIVSAGASGGHDRMDVSCVHDNGRVCENEPVIEVGRSIPQFDWREGILVEAMKSGNWFKKYLDESLELRMYYIPYFKDYILTNLPVSYDLLKILACK